MSNIKKGDQAPAFQGVNQRGESVSLANYSGKKLVLYFLPQG